MNNAAAENQAKFPRIIPDQLLVSTPYLSAVTEKLASSTFKIAVSDPEVCIPLGLTRIEFGGADYTDSPKSLIQEDGLLNIGAVLAQLRREFGNENAGWYPTMGKNRALAENVIGDGSMIYTGVSSPKPILNGELMSIRSKWNGNGTGRPSEPGTGVRVGMVDTPVLTTPPLAGAISGRYSDMLPPDSTTVHSGHATFVAGLILSVAPGATIDVRGTFGEDGRSNSWEAAKAIVELGNRVDILNLSFGCITGDGQPPLALATAIDLIDPKTIIVAAAGNFDLSRGAHQFAKIDNSPEVEIRKCASFPAALDNVIAVGSASTGKIAEYSPHGPWVDVYADGTGVESTFLDTRGFNGFATWTGTSFAAALVTGAIAAEMNADDGSAQRAWKAVRDRFRLAHLQVRQPGEESGDEEPALISSRIIEAAQWFSRDRVSGE